MAPARDGGGDAALTRSLWWLFLIAVLAARVAWETERAIWRAHACGEWPRLALALHPAWHLLSATAHGCWVAYAAAVWRRHAGGCDGASDSLAADRQSKKKVA